MTVSSPILIEEAIEGIAMVTMLPSSGAINAPMLVIKSTVCLYFESSLSVTVKPELLQTLLTCAFADDD